MVIFFCLENFWFMLVKGKICCLKICFWKNKKKICFIMYKLILDYNGVVFFEFIFDLLLLVFCFKWSVFCKKSILFFKKIY